VEFIIWVEARLRGRTLGIRAVAKVERESYRIEPEELGLTLQDGKTVLRQVQDCMVQAQANVEDAAWKLCMHCNREQRTKDLRSRPLRTVFGTVDVFCRRYVRCTCRGGRPWIMWPLGLMGLKRSTPELTYLLAKWDSMLPFRRAAELLGEFLPLSDGAVSHATIRRHTLAVGAQLEQRVTEPYEYDWPTSRRQPVKAARRPTVAIDGTYVRANGAGWLRQHYVVAGRIDRDGHMAGRFAWVAQSPTDSLDFMKAALSNNGWTASSQVAVIADGADGLKNLVIAAPPNAPRGILDWFHISMRLRPIEQMAPGLAELLGGAGQGIAETLRLKLPRVRHQMWNGKWPAAIDRMREIYIGTARAADSCSPAYAERIRRFRQHLLDLRDYLRNNWSSLTNYVRARRIGLRISSSPAESRMSHLVNQRMGKRQPMCWSSEGVHLLLQVRCAVLDDRLEALFREQYPQFRAAPVATELPAL
jgi:hypothetical protein